MERSRSNTIELSDDFENDVNFDTINKYVLSLNSKNLHIFPAEYLNQYIKLTASIGGPNAIQTLNDENLKIFSKQALCFILP